MHVNTTPERRWGGVRFRPRDEMRSRELAHFCATCAAMAEAVAQAAATYDTRSNMGGSHSHACACAMRCDAIRILHYL